MRFHLEGPERNDPDFLGQCIADINLVRKPDLVVMDATEFILTNGPSGPGEMKKENKVVAGTDIVAVDAYCAGFLEREADEVAAIQKASALGLGNINYKDLKIKETKMA